MTGVPGKPLPEGWDMIPGARGCTPQSCSFSDHHRELLELNAEVFGVSTQAPAYQREMAQRLHLPFEILSDAEFKLCDALRLPIFEIDGMRLMKRLTVILRAWTNRARLLPRLSAKRECRRVIRWLRAHPIPN